MPTVNPSRPSPSNSNGDVGNSLFAEVKVPDEAPAIAIPSSEMLAVEADEMSEYTPEVYTEPSPLRSPPKRTPHSSPRGQHDDVKEEMLIPSRPSSASPTRMRPPLVKELPAAEEVEVKKEKHVKARPQRQLAPMSFKELTGEFERILKPYYGMFAVEGTAAPGQDLYEVTGDCYHPLLAVEPSNPSTPPRSFKIHKERTVLRPGYTFVEPVLLDLPVNPLKLSNKGIQNILHMTHNMKPLPPRIDNFTHHPPSDLLFKPPCYVPKKQSTPFRQVIPAQPCIVHSGSASSCSHSSKKMSI